MLWIYINSQKTSELTRKHINKWSSLSASSVSARLAVEEEENTKCLLFWRTNSELQILKKET